MRYNIGVEITEQHLKFVVVRPLASHPKVIDCIVESISSLSDEQITKKVQDIIRLNRIQFAFCILSLPRNLVTVRNLRLPSHEEKEILQMIELNVFRIVPYKRGEIVFAHKQLGADELGYAKVILAIVHNNLIRRYFSILEKAGLFVDKISLSSCGIWEWVIANYPSEINQTDLYLLLDIEHNYTDFIIFSSTAILFTRSITIGAKDTYDDSRVGIAKLLGELKQSLIMFYNEGSSRKPAAVFVSGAIIKTELNKSIEEELGMPLKVVPPPFTSEMALAKKRELPPDVSITGVAALALRDVEGRLGFSLPEIQIRKTLREKTKQIVTVGSLVIYLLMVVCVYFLGKIYRQQSYLNKLGRNYDEAAQKLEDILPQLDKIAFVSKYLEERGLPLVVFYELENNISSEVVINSVSINETGEVSVRGRSTELSDVFNFVNALKAVKKFRDVQAKSTRKKRVKDKELTEFEITLICAN